MVTMKRFDKMLWPFRYKRAVREANKLSSLDGGVYYVLMVAGRPKVIAKRYAKKLCATRQFGRRTRIQDLEKMALYITR